MLNKRALMDFLKAIERVEIGEGDLTTEVVVPYSRFGSGAVVSEGEGYFAGKEIIDVLVESLTGNADIKWGTGDGKPIKKGDVIFTFEGKVADFISRRRIIEYVLGRATAIATKTRETVIRLEGAGKKLVSPTKVVPGYELVDNYAFRIGGGIVRSEGLKDSIYITGEHIRYGGDIEQIIAHVLEEIGVARKRVKIEVEVTSFEDFLRVNELDIDMIHISGMCEEEILKVFTRGNPRRKPVLHLNTISDWSHKFANLFLVYICVEDIYIDISPVRFKLKINGERVS